MDAAEPPPGPSSDDDLLATVASGSPQAQQALAQARQWMTQHDDIIGVGMGAQPGGAECIVVLALSPQVQLPTEIGGVPVRVELSEPPRIQ